MGFISQTFPPASSPQIAVTREMREAGAEILMTYRGVLDSESLAAHVYRAMEAVVNRE